MAKKAENKAKEPTAGLAEEEKVQEASSSIQEIPAALPDTVEDMTSEILNNDAELTDTIPEPSEEKILFYARTVNDKANIRSTPEYPMNGKSNIIDVITDRELYGITEVMNGFGRLAGGMGWIMLDSSVVMRVE